MDNQKFRLNQTIYHTNGAVLSPTSIVFSGARLESLQKALALLTEAADGLWRPGRSPCGLMQQPRASVPPCLPRPPRRRSPRLNLSAPQTRSKGYCL